MANTNPNSPRLAIGGHRGMGCTDHDFYQTRRNIAGLPVENTLESIKAAYAAGADYVEIDAVMSADGTLFTLHNVVPQDHFFHGAPKGLLNTLPFADITPFKTGRHATGVLRPLDDVLNFISDIYADHLNWLVNIEIKGVQGSSQPIEQTDYIKKLAQTIVKSKLSAEKILFSSFALHNVIAMSRELPNAHFGMLFAEQNERRPIYADRQDDPLCQYLPYRADEADMVMDVWAHNAPPSARLGYFHPEFASITSDTIAIAKRHGVGINSWALFEEMTPARHAAYLHMSEQCQTAGVPLTVITDYIDAFR